MKKPNPLKKLLVEDEKEFLLYLTENSMNKLREGKNQKVFDKRLKDNPIRIINHGRGEEDYHCRICDFSGIGSMIKAKKHAEQTGHTIDFYRENWTEITYYKKEDKRKSGRN